MVRELRERRIGVVLLTIFPVGPIPLARRLIWSDRILGAVARLNRDMLSLAGPGVDVVDCDATLAENGRMKRAFAVDEFHLTTSAYDALNRLVERRLAATQLPADSK
jgi:hypothetical protein